MFASGSHELEEQGEDNDTYSEILDDIAEHALVDTSLAEVEEPTPKQVDLKFRICLRHEQTMHKYYALPRHYIRHSEHFLQS